MATTQPLSRPVIGVDLVDVAAISESIRLHGDAYLHRVYTEGELEYARESSSELMRRLAARFAAKEATLKILRPKGNWLDWRLIEVMRSAHGHCELLLHGEAARLSQEQGIASLSVSLSHENHMAIAAVVGLQVLSAITDAAAGNDNVPSTR
ncbi:holo-[acyl-carrier protein] synthase [Panacagrimonas perspica]|uniref:Holo-[acyl-carrier-protein] synthase n=1 Tax=Panacagrimonas perspica TaxID=381431 RepID=A0A4R7PF97_9GAMM|nr:holo-ACP synthase [Panacagrimonas perspica]TDU32291.1 holo-[acyl-carrier protein] synthase [Panacagrimonas perspica]THD05234.1 holo-[acyl-carrier-protein] synthase [Panacagrimonas perspica]